MTFVSTEACEATAQAVLVEEDVLTLEGLGAVVGVDGRKGDNIIREYDSGTTIRLERALRDGNQQIPKISVHPSQPQHCLPRRPVCNIMCS